MNNFALAVALSLSVFTSFGAYKDAVLSDQPTGYWRLGDPAGSTTITNSGSLGAAGNGSPVNNVTLGVPGALTGDADTAANFDGAQSKIDAPYSPQLNPTNFTIEAWARVTGGTSGAYRSPLASRDDSPQRGFIFYAEPGNTWQFWTGTGEQVGWNTLGSTPVQEDVWDHLLGTYDGTNKLFYVNGVLVAANQSKFTPNGAQPFRIGASATESPVGDFFFIGDVDEVAVYNKVLTPDRVIAHFTQGSGAPPDSSVFPTFAVQPAGLDRFKGESATLQVIALGSLPLKYQWSKDGAVIPRATNAQFTLNSLQTTNAGSYAVDVSNAAGGIMSDAATLNVADVAKPTITTQPRSRTILPGSTITLSVAATGSTVFDYQWQFNGTNILGATNVTLTLTNVLQSNLGSYTVTVKNPAGSTPSSAAIVQFPPPATKSYALTVKDDAPVGYWRLGEASGEVAKDEVGTDDGAYLNGVVLGRPGALAGDTNTAAGFVSTNLTKVDVAWSDALNPPTFTVECWAKVTGGAGNYRSPVTSRADGPQAGYIFYAEPGNTWQFWSGVTAPTAGWFTLQGPAVVPNAYAHLVGSYDGTNFLFYVNGVLAAQGAAVFAQNGLNPLRFGAGATEGDGNFFFDGDVDEVAVYNKPLSEDRILAHYVAGFPLTTPPGITVQPTSQFAIAGGTVKFSVTATGGLPLNYQWKFNNQIVTNATSSSLTLSNVTTANVGNYLVVITNAGGNITSSVATLTIPSKSSKTYAELVKGDGPVAYWRLGETSGEVAKDEINSNDGAILNGVTLGVPGAIPNDTNTAARFSAALTQKIDVPWSDVLNPPIFSVEVWARVTGGSGNYRSPLTSRADVPQRGYIFYAIPGNTWQFWSGKGDSSGWDAIAGPAVQTNTWTHLAATYDGSIKRFYVNGVQVGTSTAPFGVNDSSPLRIGAGASEGDGNYFFEGDVDEPAVYNKVLTSEQIILHYLASTQPAATLSIAHNQGNVVLTWDSGLLQSASSITGPWALVNNAKSPYSTPIQPSGAQFYRLMLP